uniref:AP2/ERF domain-containing protein n=1 Tax=Rhizochromulina marina TaxID=1034831 RepID=A0A7S2RLG6_9STRA|mmetsp:Transcript_18003/g.52619  ORF Transcript_18003/g.52619 Transcript_18003/m.52619 type:complete len:1003 (+) Transcript_18003:307-3315(+)|eukprot:CAMPEP_0118984526 /NCGR_PEP_ID=MMETSP1173-20130426/37952_1 /TAXON_ID=1034831 /ORGANISM="Rhizochromulina marina cf, Strain CCMP1243" /LENGTH=1002 /DNA_ID=CAMNT_0006935191 /DNA_START=238 /DNA_END=3246 /DNA_ORIENTATION=-
MAVLRRGGASDSPTRSGRGRRAASQCTPAPVGDPVAGTTRRRRVAAKDPKAAGPRRKTTPAAAVRSLPEAQERSGSGRGRPPVVRSPGVPRDQRRRGAARSPTPPFPAAAGGVGAATEKEPPAVGRAYRGVHRYKCKHRALLYHQGQSVFLGTFASAEEAARAYDKKARALGKPVNFPLQGGDVAAAAGGQPGRPKGLVAGVGVRGKPKRRPKRQGGGARALSRPPRSLAPPVKASPPPESHRAGGIALEAPANCGGSSPAEPGSVRLSTRVRRKRPLVLPGEEDCGSSSEEGARAVPREVCDATSRAAKAQTQRRKRQRVAADGVSLAVLTPTEGMDQVPHCPRDLSGSTLRLVLAREEWAGHLDSMLSVCNEAARRRALFSDKNAKRCDKPLSLAYLRDRTSMDEPLRGFIVRQARTKKLQGFITTTAFSTWQRSFRWDSLCPQAGITPLDRLTHPCDDGTLSSVLMSLPRSEDSERQRVYWPHIAEISLCGALGCGTSLAKEAIADLEKQGCYVAVVLQSTKLAIPFYESFGFVRIGAVARFHDREDLPEVSHRHWTDRVEIDEPSYMMARLLSTAPRVYTDLGLADLPWPPAPPAAASAVARPPPAPVPKRGRKRNRNPREGLDVLSAQETYRRVEYLLTASLAPQTTNKGGIFSLTELLGMAHQLLVEDEDLEVRFPHARPTPWAELTRSKVLPSRDRLTRQCGRAMRVWQKAQGGSRYSRFSSEAKAIVRDLLGLSRRSSTLRVTLSLPSAQVDSNRLLGPVLATTSPASRAQLLALESPPTKPAAAKTLSHANPRSRTRLNFQRTISVEPPTPALMSPVPGTSGNDQCPRKPRRKRAHPDAPYGATMECGPSDDDEPEIERSPGTQREVRHTRSARTAQADDMEHLRPQRAEQDPTAGLQEGSLIMFRWNPPHGWCECKLRRRVSQRRQVPSGADQKHCWFAESMGKQVVLEVKGSTYGLDRRWMNCSEWRTLPRHQTRKAINVSAVEDAQCCLS